MLSIVRGGPRTLLLRGRKEELIEILSGRILLEEHTLAEALDVAVEGQTILVVSSGKKGGRGLWIADAPSEEILAFLISGKGKAHVDSAALLPRILFFRVFGDKERVFQQMIEDYDASRGTLRHILRSPRRDSVAICFTQKALNQPITMEDLFDDVLYIKNTGYEELFASLQNKALWYFSEGLEKRQWNELEIRITDAWGCFRQQYERLRLTLEALEVGMILGEGWGKDFARILMPIQIYKIRLFTFLSPRDVKEILIGLEYGGDGERLVDFDLYSQREKISWGGSGVKEKNRDELGRRMRMELLRRLDSSVRTELDEQEREIHAMRKRNETSGCP